MQREETAGGASQGQNVPLVTAFLTFAFVLLAYFPVSVADFRVHDDYWLEQMSPSPHCRTTIEYRSMVQIGRPLSAEGIRCVMKPLLEANLVSETNFWRLTRFINAVSLGAMAAIFGWVLLRLTQSRTLAIWGAVGLATVPGIGVMVAAGISAGHTYIAPLAGVAVALYYSASKPGRSRLAAASLFALACLIMTVALYTYQVYGLIVPALVVFIALLCPWENWSAGSRFCIAAATGILISFAVYYLSNKYLVRELWLAHVSDLKEALPLGESRKFEVSLSPMVIFENLRELWLLVYRRAMDLWFIRRGDAQNRTAIIGTALALVAVSAIVAWFRMPFIGAERRQHAGSRLFCLALGLVAACSFFLLYGPAAWYRVLTGLMAINLFIFGWAAMTIVAVVVAPAIARRAAATAMILIGVLMAQYNTIAYYAVTSIREYEFIRGAVQPLFDGTSSKAVFDPPKSNFWIVGDEYSVITTALKTHYGIRGVIERAARERGLSRSDFTVVRPDTGPVEISMKSAPAAPSLPTTFVYGEAIRSVYELPVMEAKASSNAVGEFGLRHLMKEGVVTPWHAQRPPKFPEWVEVALQSARSISAIVLAVQRKDADVYIDRMPRDLRVEWLDEKGIWRPIEKLSTRCKADKTGISITPLPAPVLTSKLKITFLSNCGNKDLLTFEKMFFIR